MTGNEIRKSFVEFFKSKQHKHYESASLVPDDKTLLLTVAGMVPFKKFFLGEQKAPYKRVTTYQKCIRTNDLENVGVTPRHQTFFEMLGNFSFGDYFKKEAIEWSWEYITEVLKLDQDRLWVSVYKTDDEAYEIWNKIVGVPESRIVRLGDEDNWWAAGPVGSCGPCSEIYYDTQNMGANNEELNCKPGDEGNRFLEIWNLVFTEWNRLEDGSLVPLPEKNIDTGAGIERVASVVQNKKNNFETDLFSGIIDSIRKVLSIDSNKYEVNEKIIADHIRASVFLICDGVLPTNEGRGYILKKLIRRAYGTGSIANKEIFENGGVFLYKLVDSVVDTMKEGYPELVDKSEYISKVILEEETKFSKTLKTGLELLMQDIKNLDIKKLSGDKTFKLYDTFGFPFELTKLVCKNEGVEVSEEEFNEKLEEQVRRSKESRVVLSDMIKDEFIDSFVKEHGVTEFTGYRTLVDTAKILHVKKLDDSDEIEIIFDKTPFYAEQGGQVSDKGIIYNDNFSATVVGLTKKSDVFIHYIKLTNGNIPNVLDTVNQEVDKVFRAGTMRNHTATHILHKAIKEVLGDDVNQAGSLVYDKGLRFDYTYSKPLTQEQIITIERRVNEIIQNNNKVEVTYTDLETAKKMNVIALFGEKYKDIVRVVDIVDYSAELCGGTHCPSTGIIGSFYILSDQSKASGIRRIEAITAMSAYEYCKKNMMDLNHISQDLKVKENEIIPSIDKLKDEIKHLNEKIEGLKSKLIYSSVDEILSNKENINGVNILIKKLDINSKDLKTVLDAIKQKDDNIVALLSTVNDDKLTFACCVSSSLTNKYKAGDIVKYAANIAGGNGGGRADFAQAGAKDITKLDEALKLTKEYLIGK